MLQGRQGAARAGRRRQRPGLSRPPPPRPDPAGAGPAPSSPGRALRRLRRWLPPPVAATLAALAAAGGHPAIVGGAVRDAVRGHRPADWDLVVDLSPTAIARACPAGRRVGRAHPIVLVTTAAGVVEVTALARAPGEDVAVTIERDLCRRDFTINAMAVSARDWTLLDPFGGVADLAAGRLRVGGGAPAARLAADPARALRAARLCAGLGMAPDPGLRAALTGAWPALQAVPWDRQRQEVERILLAAGAAAGVAALAAWGALAWLLPMAPATARSAAVDAVDRAPAVPVLRLATWLTCLGLYGAPAGAAVRRWGMGAAAATHMARLTAAAVALGRVPPAGAARRAWVARSRTVAEPAARVALALHGAAFARLPAQARRARASPLVGSGRLALAGDVWAELEVTPAARGRLVATLVAEVLAVPARNREGWLRRRARALAATPGPGGGARR